MNKLRATQESIIFINETFTKIFSKKMNLQKVLGPLIIDPNTCLNDNLTGNNHPIKFHVDYLKRDLEICQSLAKWKRIALQQYGFDAYEGIYVDMKAIRSHENLDNLHSLFVDQWDWEKVIKNEDRTIAFLKEQVEKIYECIYETENIVNEKYRFAKKLPKEIYFVSSQEIEDKFGIGDYEKAVDELTKEHKAIFVYQIGGKLKSGNVFDNRSYEYDDWNLNGDLFVYSNTINKAIEISSMGIRVDKESLIKQGNLECEKALHNQYHELIINNKVPLTIGGGIGQSRLNMFLLEKKHVGEVQVSVWDDNSKNNLKSEGIEIL